MIKVALLTTDSREHFKDYLNPQPYFGTAPQALLEGFKLLPDEIELHVLSCLQELPVSSPAKLADNIYYHALHVPKIGWLKTGYQGCIRAVRRRLREINPDIVHGQGTERDCALCASWSGFPNVLTIHGVMRAISALSKSRLLSYYWFAKHLETLSLRRTGGVITISPYVQDLISTLTSRTWFIPNALQSFFFDHSSAPLRHEGPPRLVNVGVVSPRKRQLELLEHLSRLRAQTSFEITFVGKTNAADEYTRRFMQMLSDMNSRYGNFMHHEFLPAELFKQLYDNSDAMIHFSSEESFGLTFAEALSRNVYLFASDVGAIRQISKDIPNCEIFGADDFPGLIESLKRWIDAAAYSQARVKPPNALIFSRYHPKVVALRHLAVYREILSLQR
jgi:glycosyltransferase involved in cell wall biosynthesis